LIELFNRENTMSKEVELRECPLCSYKGIATYRRDTRDGYTLTVIYCPDCGCNVEEDNRERAIRSWNTRHQDSVLEEIERAVESLDIYEMLHARYEDDCVILEEVLDIFAKHKTGEGL
jgi:hypothetical protein